MNINKNIFKAYDIRGIYPNELDENTAYLVAKALVKYLNAKSIVAAHDMRVSSDSIYEAVLRGLKEMGIKIFDVGLATTPMYMYVINTEKADGGIIVTASHNSAEYNGLRMEGKAAISIGEGSGMEEIRDMVLSGEIAATKSDSKFEIEKSNYAEKYIDFIVSKFSKKDFFGLNIAIDAGNGMAGMILPEILKKLEIHYIPLYFDLDGSFPNHNPDPSKAENLRDLGELVVERGVDLGIAFDGDGDRVGFVDSKGEAIDMDYISSFWAREVLKENPGEKIIYDLSSSKIVRDTIEENNGQALMCRTGHSFFRKIIRQENAYFGCEKSGHCMLKEFFYVEAAILSALHILKLVNQSHQKIEDLIKPFKKYFSFFEEINLKDKEKFPLILKLLELEYKDGIISYFDGISVEYPEWWFNIRQSNTEPILRLHIEARDQSLAEEKKEEIIGKIKNLFL